MYFEFTTWASDTKYAALEVANGSFVVYTKDQSPSEGAYWERSEVYKNLLSGAWKKAEEIKQPFFSVKEDSIESAARFIVANNRYRPYANIKECEDDIKRYIRRMIKQIKNGEESYMLSTAGWTILINLEDEDYYGVEVLVNPSVSQDREFVNVEEII